MGDPNNKALMKAAAAVDGKEWNDEDVPSKKSASVSSSSSASDDEGGPTTSESISSSAGASGTKRESKTEKNKKKEQATSKPKPVVKDYIDYSQVSPPVLAKKMAGTLAINKTLPAKEPTFPVKLHMILSNSSLESIISWLPHGRSWRILQQSEFEEKVIPLYFRHGKFNSFARQVSGWGFNRITAGADFNSYYHELFLRGKPHLCHLMKRLTAKESAKRKESKRSGQADASIVPDFYLMDRTKPLPLNDPKDARPLPDYLLKSVGPGVQSNQTSEINPVQGAISGTVKSDTIPTQASTTMPPPPPVNTTDNVTMVVATLLSAMLSTGQIQPHQLAAVLGLSAAAAPPPPVVPQPSQQPTINNQSAYYQLALNMAAASGQTGGGGFVLPIPAPAASAFYQPPAQQDPPKKSENLMAELVQAYQQAQHVQAQPQVAAHHHHHHCPVQQPQPQQPMASHPQHQSRENNTTGQTIANFLIDRSQHKQQMIQEKHDKKQQQQQLVQQEQEKQQQQLKLQQQQEQQQPAAAPPDIAALLLQSLQQAQQQPHSAPLAQQKGSGIADLATWLFSQQSGPPPNP